MLEVPKEIYLIVKDNDGEDIDDEIYWCPDRINDTDIKYVRADLPQSIGIKDKNGIEIKEGDIINIPSRGINFTCLVDKYRDLEPLTNKNWSHMLYSPIWKESEVIGNKFENPELIEVAHA